MNVNWVHADSRVNDSPDFCVSHFRIFRNSIYKFTTIEFEFGDMEYFAGIKLFNNVIDRLGVDIDLQRRYEVFDRIYEEGMREKKFEQSRNSR